MRRQGIASGVEGQTGAARQSELELDVSRLHLVELHVPVAEGGHSSGRLDTLRHLGERRAVRWERPCWESVATYPERQTIQEPTVEFLNIKMAETPKSSVFKEQKENPN